MPTVSGTVVDAAGNGIIRRVRVHLRSTGAVIGEGLSNGITGHYAVPVPTTAEVYAVLLDDSAGVRENDQIQRVLPT